MKFCVVVPDGMADDPCEELDGKTPVEAASTPNLDRIARQGRLGLVRLIPKGLSPGSDVANLALLGYDPKEYYTGRAPLEAAGIQTITADLLEPGVDLAEVPVYFIELAPDELDQPAVLVVSHQHLPDEM